MPLPANSPDQLPPNAPDTSDSRSDGNLAESPDGFPSTAASGLAHVWVRARDAVPTRVLEEAQDDTAWRRAGSPRPVRDGRADRRGQRHDHHDGGTVAVSYGGTTVTGHANRGSVAWDATVELRGSVSLPTELRYVARTASIGGSGTAPRYAVIDAMRAGLGTTRSAGSTAVTASGNRLHLHLRRLP